MAHLQTIDAIRMPKPRAGIVHSFYRFYCYLRPDRIKEEWDRSRIIAGINDLGVPCFSGSCSEIYREKAFGKHGFVPAMPMPVAAELGETSIMFLVHSQLTDVEIEDTCQAISLVFDQAAVSGAAS